MTESTKATLIELAHRTTERVDVTLFLVRRARKNEALVCVFDGHDGSYFEVPTETYLALDVYYHPFAYRDFCTAEHQDSRFAA